jgi:hypothetical protein
MAGEMSAPQEEAEEGQPSPGDAGVLGRGRALSKAGSKRAAVKAGDLCRG